MIIHKHLPHGAKSQTPRQIIVHAMQAEYAPLAVRQALQAMGREAPAFLPGPVYADRFLDLIGLSAHALVKPNGDIVVLREDNEGAYHAKGFNTDSLGIEFLVPGQATYGQFLRSIEQPWVAKNQLLAGARWVAEWMSRWNITQIRGHCDVDPARKKDPGQGFPWAQFRELL